jgi:dTDP-4-amino-4,6-dideoxygalactose transaminase
MSDIMAAIGRTQLRRFENEFKPKRVALARCYRELLAETDGIELFDSHVGEVVPHIMPMKVLDGRRDGVRQALLEQHIQSGVHYKPNHLLTKFGGGAVSLPQAERLYTELLTLPLHPAMEVGQVELIVATVRNRI